jgi:hypothetical protein
VRTKVLVDSTASSRIRIHSSPTSEPRTRLLPKRNLGQGRPVLVVPGIGAIDGMTKRLRNHLRAHGFHLHGWRLGRNKGLTDEILNGLSDRLVDLHERHGQPVILIGWSFGGLRAGGLPMNTPTRFAMWYASDRRGVPRVNGPVSQGFSGAFSRSSG